MSGMRLLNVHSLQVEDFTKRPAPQYVILSHRWVDNEPKFQDFEEMHSLQATTTNTQRLAALRNCNNGNFGANDGFAKVAWACKMVRERQHGVQYLWADTCCINKNNLEDPKETSRAINSMFDWYHNAVECYAYLGDTSGKNAMRNSVWFKRGWTLQELLAPSRLQFFDQRWTDLGTRSDNIDAIWEATSIDQKYLNGDEQFRSACIATKMSWAANRTTALADDRAYCMLGLFGVHIEAPYGEGMKAFLRLQEELVNRTNDESIFAWYDASIVQNGLLAPSPKCFEGCGQLTVNSAKFRPRKSYSAIKEGIEFWLPSFLPDHANGADWNDLIANKRKSFDLRLNCWRPDGRTVVIKLRKEKGKWRRTQCDQEFTINKAPRSSESIFGIGTKARPAQISHNV
ncbi:hypothetical protein EV356DRAFT_510315 [Viridothelium virens]|uniref:Uncharacterized protein n=1 Tax=Viridothelium virens TaxID=1048519 RepID=A0A6A6GVD9_VIRVR|nr:hypothetical protein EV356DRAFT_510315 [Viridothelium virens]